MINYMFLFLKGFVIGFGKIIPGVSGSFLAITLGVYEESIKRIHSFRKKFKENLLYFFPLLSGIVLAIVLGSHLLLFFYEKYYLLTMMFFIGLIFGTFPSLFKEHSLNKHGFLVVLFLFFLIVFLFHHLSFPVFVMKHTFSNYLFIFFLGGVEVFTTMIPGVSGTATYMMLGAYEFLLNLFAHPFLDILAFFSFALGGVLSFLFLVKLLYYFLHHQCVVLWRILYAFLLYAMYYLLQSILPFLQSFNLCSCILVLLVGFQIGFLFSKVSD